MNERIKNLMGKTLDAKFKETWTTMTFEDLEKFAAYFAKLLVEDCANTAYSFDGITLGQGYDLAKHIKKTYDIKE